MSVEWTLTPQQVEDEEKALHERHSAVPLGHAGHDDHAHPDHGHLGVHGHGDHFGYTTAATLAARAAITLAEAEDMLIFNGLGAFTNPFFQNNVRWRANGEPADWGLLDVIPSTLAAPTALGPLPPSQVIQVIPKAVSPTPEYGEKTFEAVTDGYATLMGNGQYGPFALTLHNVPYADAFAPLTDTLIMPADRIGPLMTAGFRDSGTLDAPGAAAAKAGADAAAAAVLAGAQPTQVQEAAANAAASYAIGYGAALVVNANPLPATDTALAVAAKAGSLAAQAAGAGEPDADNMGETAAYFSAKQIPNYPGLPQGANTPIAALGPPSYYGSLVSLGGNTMDLVVGIEATAGFMQENTDGTFCFRVYERIALRLKDISAVIRLEFQ